MGIRCVCDVVCDVMNTKNKISMSKTQREWGRKYMKLEAHHGWSEANRRYDEMKEKLVGNRRMTEEERESSMELLNQAYDVVTLPWWKEDLRRWKEKWVSTLEANGFRKPWDEWISELCGDEMRGESSSKMRLELSETSEKEEKKETIEESNEKAKKSLGFPIFAESDEDERLVRQVCGWVFHRAGRLSFGRSAVSKE